MRIPEASGERRIWLRVGILLDGSGNAPLKDAHVVYSAEEILYAGAEEPPRDIAAAGQSAPDAELPEWTLLPGLIEAHAHFFLQGSELDAKKRSAYLQQSREQLLEQATARLKKLARLGVAGVRDAGDKHRVGLALSRMRRSAGIPYVDSPGAAIHRRGRYGGFMAEPLEDFSSPRACVEARVKAGADRIKILATGAIDFESGTVKSPPQMTVEEIAEMTAAARELGKQTLAHASGDAGIEQAIEGGVDSIEHGYFVREDQLARMRDREIAWVPTLAPVQRQMDYADRMGWNEETLGHLRRILDGHAASLVKAQPMGVTILAGSDAGSYGVEHGLGLLYEMELMERAGLAPAAVIHAATGAAARRLGFGEKFGEIRPGYRSRFLLARHLPLETVANLRREKTIVFDGAVFDAAKAADVHAL